MVLHPFRWQVRTSYDIIHFFYHMAFPASYISTDEQVLSTFDLEQTLTRARLCWIPIDIRWISRVVSPNSSNKRFVSEAASPETEVAICDGRVALGSWASVPAFRKPASGAFGITTSVTSSTGSAGLTLRAGRANIEDITFSLVPIWGSTGGSVGPGCPCETRCTYRAALALSH